MSQGLWDSMAVSVGGGAGLVLPFSASQCHSHPKPFIFIAVSLSSLSRRPALLSLSLRGSRISGVNPSNLDPSIPPCPPSSRVSSDVPGGPHPTHLQDDGGGVSLGPQDPVRTVICGCYSVPGICFNQERRGRQTQKGPSGRKTVNTHIPRTRRHGPPLMAR